MTAAGPLPRTQCTQCAGSHSLQFLLLTQKFGYPSGCLLYKAKVFVKNVLKGMNRYPMGQSQLFYADTMIFFNVGGNSGDEIAWKFSLFSLG